MNENIKIDFSINEEDFTIDRFNLEIQAELVPELIREYGKKLSYAEAQTKNLKSELEYTEAQVAEYIRANPEMFDIVKTNDSVVFGLAKGQEEYKVVLKKYTEAMQVETDLRMTVKSLESKSDMIKELIRLFLNNYYAPVKVKEERKPPRAESVITYIKKNKPSLKDVINKRKKLKLRSK